jgi:Skp family chaperone for outer membrane proteins
MTARLQRWAVALLFVAGPAAAQTEGTLPRIPAGPAPQDFLPAQPPAAQILTLDKERLFSGSRFGQAITRAVEVEVAALTAENRQIDAALEAEERELTEKRPTMTPAEFRVLADAFDEKVTALRSAQDGKSKALTRMRDEGRQRFFEAAVPILAALMQDMGALAILSNEAVILSFDRIDMTDEAIARLDAALGDGADILPSPDASPSEDPAPSP